MSRKQPFAPSAHSSNTMGSLSQNSFSQTQQSTLRQKSSGLGGHSSHSFMNSSALNAQGKLTL